MRLLERLHNALTIFDFRQKPKDAIPINNFEVERYLGIWYEIARLNHFFEKNVHYATAEYSLKNDGTINVSNQGYNKKKKKWTSITGTARFQSSQNIGALSVTFFKPFSGAYNIVLLDDNYQYALVVGNNLSYLWLLSRFPTIPEATKDLYLQKARELGYDTSKLIWCEQKELK